jgi:hypothetical protein
VFLARWAYANFRDLGETFQKYVFYYLAMSAFISAIYCYYRGPISNPKAINIINFLLKIVGIMLMFYGLANKEMFAALIISGAIAKWFKSFSNMLMNNKLVNKIM